MKTKKLSIDCSTQKTSKAIHAYIAKYLDFPDYYGANLDALADCTSDSLLERKIVLIWKDTAASKKNAEMQAIKKLLVELTR
jgi:RNAse (barnase) inhibitor barstar